MITDIDDYFSKGCGRCARFATPDCSTRKWHDGLIALREICTDAGLTETVKWGHPCYMHGNNNIALLNAFRDDFSISFFNPALLKDPQGILEKRGPNTQNAGLIRFADTADVAAKKTVIAAYLQEAMHYAEAGVKPPKQTPDIVLPDELVAALDDDPILAEAFQDLTPGRQRSYVINLSSAKKPETRVARIAKFRDHILAGKGATER